MNVATHQEKEKNEKTGKRKAGEEKKRANFKEAACYPSAVVQGAAQRKNGLCEGSAWGNWDLLKGQQPFGPNPDGVWDRTTTLRRQLIRAVQFCSLYMYCTYYICDTNFALHYLKKSESIRVLGTDRRSVVIIRVKVNSKSELVENREEKSGL